MSFEFVGPFRGPRLVLIDDWTVPLIEAIEMDGGTVEVTVDDRLGYTLPAGEAENVLRLVADVIAVAWGYGAHANLQRIAQNDGKYLNPPLLSRVPHPAIGPTRMYSVGEVRTEESTA